MRERSSSRCSRKDMRSMPSSSSSSVGVRRWRRRSLTAASGRRGTVGLPPYSTVGGGAGGRRRTRVHADIHRRRLSSGSAGCTAGSDGAGPRRDTSGETLPRWGYVRPLLLFRWIHSLSCYVRPERKDVRFSWRRSPRIMRRSFGSMIVRRRRFPSHEQRCLRANRLVIQRPEVRKRLEWIGW